MSTNERNQLGQFIPLHYHFQMLSDTPRVQSFKAAIERVVKPHHQVVELGSGTGVLSFFAASIGANVQSIEFNPDLVIASRKFLDKNGVGDRVTVIEADATKWTPDQPVDVVVCEMLHSALLREKQVEVIQSFREKHQEKFGVIPIFIPSASLLGVQPVMQNYTFEGYQAEVPLFQSPYHVASTVEVNKPVVYQIVDYDSAIVEQHECKAQFSFNQGTTFNAFRFITKNLLASNTTGTDIWDWHNQHLLFPTSDEILVEAGQVVTLTFSYTAGDPIDVITNTMEISIQ
jgi:type I protein arginine methyltransferase